MSTDRNNDAEDPVERAILAALHRHADTPQSSSEDDEALISAAVTAHLQANTPSEKVVSLAARKSSTPWLAAAGLLAAAAAAALWLLPAGSDSSSSEATSVTSESSSSPTQAMWVLEGEQDPVKGVTTTTREACGTRNDTRACLTPGSRGNFEADGNLQLHQGGARVEAQEPIIVFLPAAQLSLSTDAANFSTSYAAGLWTVEVASGVVTLTGPDGVSRVLQAGESASNEDAQAMIPVDSAVEPASTEGTTDAPASAQEQQQPKPVLSADELLTLARSQRTAKDFRGAARSYEKLVRSHPESTKARAALVSLAQLYQGPLADPAKALPHFNSYLRRGGPLAEEALYGKIRALRSLGREDEARKEIALFSSQYPNSAHADALRDE